MPMCSASKQATGVRSLVQLPKQADEVVLTVTAKGGEPLDMVRHADGTYGIAAGGVELRSLFWPADRFNQCAAVLCALIATAPAGSSTKAPASE
jgi:hypothetical protein